MNDVVDDPVASRLQHWVGLSKQEANDEETINRPTKAPPILTIVLSSSLNMLAFIFQIIW